VRSSPSTEATTKAAALLGSIKTPKKSASSRATIKKAHAGRRAKRRAVLEIPCECSGGASLNRSDHVGACPRYQAIYYREKHGLPIQ